MGFSGVLWVLSEEIISCEEFAPLSVVGNLHNMVLRYT